ncbi:MAG TPA: phosphatase PAP2 family protein, partial [Bacteroidota bacterium]|nr:phosphatase PAP2 family protein [Bacteroidota bacterium]
MPDFLYALDVAVFRFLNGTLGNPVSDGLMPFLTDLNQTWYGRVLYAGAWLLLLLRGGKPGRTAAILLVPLIALSDQLSSSVVKKIVMRPRPCHLIDGLPLVDQIRLLVNCGGGYSFPSSHAVNNFAAATLLSHHFPKWNRYYFGWAALIALSRISVGVHYPSDIAGGMLIGMLTAWIFLSAWKMVLLRYPGLDPFPAGHGGDGQQRPPRP